MGGTGLVPNFVANLPMVTDICHERQTRYQLVNFGKNVLRKIP